MSQKIKTSVEIDGSLTANSIVKSGGTASQILAADGSVVTAGSGVTISGGTISASGSAGVLSFNTRTGAVTLTSGDVTTALGYTPYNASNPAGYISSYTETDTLATVTGRGATTSILSTFDGGLNIGNAKLRWGGNTSPTLGFPFTGGPNAFWIDVNDGDTGGIALDNDGTTIYGAGDSGHVFRVIDEDVYQTTSNIDASTTFRIQQGQNGGGYVRGNFEITGYTTIGGSAYLASGNSLFFDSGVTNDYSIRKNGTALQFDSAGDFTFNKGINILTTRDNALVLRAMDGGTNPWNYIEYVNSAGTRKYYVGTDTSNVFNIWSDDGTGYVASNTSFRSPIFYDSGNTSYYLDPASTSNLLGLTVTNTITGNISGNAATASNLSGGINLSTSGISSMKVNDTRYWVTDPNAPGNYFQALTMGNGSDFTQIGVNSSNQMYYRFNGTGSTWYTVLSSNNYSSYTVPLTRTITINGTSYDLSANRSWTVTANETDTLQTVTSRGNVTSTPIILRTSYPYMQFEDTVTGTTKFAWQQLGVTLAGSGAGGGGYFTTYSQDKPFGWTIGGNQGVMTIDTSGNVQALTSSRAPIFYDSNNTAFYLDPNGTSNINQLIVAGDGDRARIYLRSSGNFPNDLWFGSSNTNHWSLSSRESSNPFLGLYNASLGSWAFTVEYSNNSVNFTTDVRSPIFYDANNTGYYLDPNSGSNLNNVTANEFYTNGWFRNNTTNTGLYNQVNGNHIYSRQGKRWGITGNDAAGSVWLDFYGNHESTYRGSVHADTSNNIGFLTNDGGWGLRIETNKNAHFHGNTVYIGADGQSSSNIIMQDSDHGDRQIHCNSNRIGFLNQSGGWGSWCEDNGDFYSAGTSIGVGAMQAPVFYDYNNTAYYWEPATDASHRFQTPSGYIDIGPKNGGHCHIYTDRPSFYFNQTLLVNGNTVWHGGNAPRAANSYVMFYEGFTLNADSMSTNSTGFTYSSGAPWTGPIARFSTGGGYDLWLNASYGGDGTALSYRTRNGDAGTNNSWHRIYSDSYKPNADKVNGYGGYDHVGSGLRPFYNWGGSNGGASAPNGSTYTNGISVGSHPSDPAYGFQIANNMWNTGLWTRSYNSYSFDGWVRLLDSSNYSQYCDFGGNTVYGAAFYDANDTGYYVNPAGSVSGKLSGTLTIGGSGPSNYGEGLRIIDSNNHSIVVFGATGNTGVGRYQFVKTNGDDLELRNATGGIISIWRQGGYVDFGYVKAASYSLDNGFKISQGSSNYASINSWMYLEGYHGLYAGNNGAHFYPNDASYGSWKIQGTRNGWGGLEFAVGSNGNVSLMLGTNSATTGFHNNSYGWQLRWGSGTLYSGRGAYGGDESIVLQEDKWTNQKYFGSGGEIYATQIIDSVNTAFYFDGNNTGDSIRVAGDIVAYYSDERLKDRKGNIENALEKVLSLNGFYYTPNAKAQELGYEYKEEVGVSAQEVEAILPEIIKNAPIGQGYKTLNYGKLTPLLIEAIKEQTSIIDNQQTQIDELKELVNKLINKQ